MKYAPYSFSKIQTYFTCQKKFDFSYINKIEIDCDYSDPSYFVRGRFLHSYLADRLNGGDGLSSSGKYSVSTEDKLKLIECGDAALENEFVQMSFDFDVTMIEKSISLDIDLKPATSKKDIAIKGFCDYFAVSNDYAMIIDWKTGKHRDNPNFSQLELYAIWVLQQHPEITEMDLLFYYVEHDKFELKTVFTDDLKKLKKDLSSKIKTIENTELFEKNIGNHCNDCPFLTSCSNV